MSAVLCGIAGLLLANLNAYASPSSMSWIISGELIVMVVLGGMGSVVGPVFGALGYLGAEELLKSVTDHWMIAFGLGIVVLAVVGQAGWAQLATRLRRFRPGRSTDGIDRKQVVAEGAP